MKIFVGCSSSENIDEKYLKGSKELLDLVLKDNDLVFGACNKGIMGLAYDSAISHGRQVIGICPEAYKEDFKSLNCTKEIVTNSVSERTNKLIEESDILLFLPGGIGTYFELFSAIEGKRCHEFNKLIILFNSNGFFDKFKEMLIENYENGFLKESDLKNVIITDNAHNVMSNIKAYENPDSMEASFEYGIFLIKDSLKGLQSGQHSRRYSPLFDKYNDAISVIEYEVAKQRSENKDTNDFYKVQCDKLSYLYHKLTMEYLMAKKILGTRKEKKQAEKILDTLTGKNDDLDNDKNNGDNPLSRKIKL